MHYSNYNYNYNDKSFGMKNGRTNQTIVKRKFLCIEHVTVLKGFELHGISKLKIYMLEMII